MARISACLAATAMIAGVVILALTAGTARADSQNSRVCAPSATELVEQLDKAYGEVLTAAGIDAKGNLVQVYSSATGSFTIAITKPGGPTCVVSAGENWVHERTAKMPNPGKSS